ncbi:MAG: adenylate/guanylate cyclase domain-containing protein [Pseudomonadota bacterium]
MRSGSLGSLAALAVGLFFLFGPSMLVERINQPAIDAIATLWPPPGASSVAVVDIDSASLSAFEGRRLSRARLAELIETVSGMGASAIALDLVLEPPCDPSMPGVQRLAAAIGAANATMGFLLSNEDTVVPAHRSPVAFGEAVRLPEGWIAPGAEPSCAVFSEAAAGMSALSLEGDYDALIRSAPAVIAVQDQIYPSVAIDVLRLSQGTGAVLLFGEPPQIRIGELQARLDDGGNLRLRYSTGIQEEARTISASDILGGGVSPDHIAGKTVFIGSSAAELAGLRAVPGNPLKASVQIHADVAANLLTGSSPHIPSNSQRVSTLIAIAFGILLAFFAAAAKPLSAAAISLIVVGAWLAICAYAFHRFNLILEPLVPVLVVTAGAVLSSGLQFSAVRRAETVIRQRFEQRLPAAVVKKLVAEPELLKLKGEQRIATSMFTDVEGFTSTTERTTPAQMIALLDRYFEGLSGIIIGHGGMIEKTIGDGIHALFNAPVDLDNHAAAALDCARDILAFSEQFRKTEAAAEAGFGRTRIGIETGEVVLGDVGVADRVDYTAFGSSVNTAARLQDANKKYGTSVLLGARTKALIGDDGLEDVGEIELRGIGVVHAFGIRCHTPDPQDSSS